MEAASPRFEIETAFPRFGIEAAGFPRFDMGATFPRFDMETGRISWEQHFRDAGRISTIRNGNSMSTISN